jgi:spermidine/putrescine transport system permease protein
MAKARPPRGENYSASVHGGSAKLGPLYAGPMGLWFTLFFMAPIAIIVIYSFLKKGLYGGVVWKFSPDAYKELFTNPAIGATTLRTVIISIVSTIITILLALPAGYYMAKSRHQTLLLLIIIIPFWTNFLIRVFAWMNILGNNGFLNVLLLKIGLTKNFIPFLYNNKAVTVVLIYMYLPYAILPLFSTIDKFDFSLLEAARDLGASKLGAIVRVMLPNIRSGLYTAVLFTFIPIFGQYAVPLLVGGKSSYMLGNVIADQLTKSRNWPLASAISMVLTFVTTIGVMLMLNLQHKETALVGEQPKNGGRNGR